MENNNLVKGAKSVKDTFQQLDESFEEYTKIKEKYPFGKLGKKIRQAIQNGTIWLFLSIISFTIGMALLLVEISQKRNTAVEIKNTNEKILGTELEPRRPNNRPGIVSAVLSPYDQKLNPEEKKASRTIRSIFDAFRLNPDYVTQIDSIGEVGIKGALFRQHRPAFVFYADSFRITVPPTEYLCEEKEFRKFERYFSNKSSRTIRELRSVNRNGCFSRTSWQAFLYALMVEDISLEKSDSLPQVYFISIDGLLAHKVFKDMDRLRVSDDIPMYRWEASSYFQAFIGADQSRKMDEDIYISKAYLDIAGLGIVRTYSKVVQDEGTPIGILCIDERIKIDNIFPDNTYANKFKENRYIHWSNNVFDYHLFRLNLKEDNPLPEKADGPFQEDLKKYVALARKETAGDQNTANFRSVTSVDDLSPSGTSPLEAFRLPLSIENNIHHLLYIKPVEHYPLDKLTWRLGAAILLIFLAFAMVFKASRIVAESNERATTATILRNLPIGVLELDGNYSDGQEKVRVMNDYAEESFGEVSPRFGEKGDESGIAYQQLIDPSVIIVRNTQGTRELDRKNIDYLVERRKAGLTSSYYTLLNSNLKNRPETKRWIEVTGSPLIEAESGMLRTFGIFRIVKDEDLVNKLDTFLATN